MSGPIKLIKLATMCVFVSLISGAINITPAETIDAEAAAPSEEIIVAVVGVEENEAAPVEVELLMNEQSPLPERAPYATAGSSENPFSGHSWYTPPPAQTVSHVPPPPVIREPTAPPLPYKLLGSYEQAGSATLYFLVKGDRVYDVAIGDTLDGTYSVDGVVNGQLMLTYLPLNTSQGLRLGE
jgi:hypothetical protein